MKRLTLTILLVGCVLTGCAKRPSPVGVNVTEDDALVLAKQEFARHGRKVEDYRVSIEYDKEQVAWLVWFDLDRELPVAGGRHGVLVHKNTSAVIFLEGE